MDFLLLIIVFLAAFIGFGLVLRDMAQRRDTALQERDEARKQLADRLADLREAQVVIARQQSALEERDKAAAQNRRELDTHFEGIASKVLKANTEELRKQAAEQLQMHRELAGKDMAASKAAVEGLVGPMKENLEKLRSRVEASDAAHASVTAEVRQGVEQLARQTSDLRRILDNPQTRGQWGEQHLRNVLEAAGMTSHVDYCEQVPVDSATGTTRLRPDVLVHIPHGTKVVIDAKTPHEKYDQAMRCEDKRARQTLLKEHAKALAGHAKEIARRGYAESINGSLDFVVMYVPIESMLETAVRADPDIWQESWHRHRVLIATPGVLIAFLRTVALAWSRLEIQSNAEEISKQGKELYSRLATYTNHVERMGRGLRQAVDAYNESVGSFESRLLVQARRFEELGAAQGKQEIDRITPIEAVPRHLSAPELLPASEAGR
ncbi:MAG: DNA recombination protein RmuC [Bryobacterales bacterium]|nr:DNA recombination protein RmuC [Bryobacterales bacterium]